MDALNISLDKTGDAAGLIHIVSVSTHEPNLELVRNACLERWSGASYVHLSTKASAIEFAHSMLRSSEGTRPSIIFLDLDASPEESWTFLEQVQGTLETGPLLKVGLAMVEESEDAARRFGNMVTTVLPLPKREAQAHVLIGLIGESWMGPKG